MAGDGLEQCDVIVSPVPSSLSFFHLSFLSSSPFSSPFLIHSSIPSHFYFVPLSVSFVQRVYPPSLCYCHPSLFYFFVLLFSHESLNVESSSEP